VESGSVAFVAGRGPLSIAPRLGKPDPHQWMPVPPIWRQ